jgi:hypothetical protein
MIALTLFLVSLASATNPGTTPRLRTSGWQKSSEGWRVLPEENNAIKAAYSRRRLTENGLSSRDLESRFYAVLSKAAQVA